jgi:hypothetical protein
MSKKMINLYFDSPKVNSLLSDDIDTVAINWEISHDAALIKCFEVLVNSLGRHNSGGSTYFDLLMCDCFQKRMTGPEITFGTHGSKVKLPMLVFKEDWALHEPTGRKLPITSKMLNRFGQMFSEEFEIEYLGFEKIGLSSTPTKEVSFIGPMDMIYLLNNRPHVFDGKKFLPVMTDLSLSKAQ